ncbi:MAG: vitamin B12-dependent ribonucleotide reductase [Deltaproteobacteria bacterium]|nr:vitamin B12-dependent ribonucleotide reductase [Deltaproteobacteria bacterium]
MQQVTQEPMSKRKAARPQPKGLKLSRRFTKVGVHPFDEIEWELRSAVITDEKGKVVFEQKNIEIPRAWSQMATNVVVSKYFRGQIGTPQRESSVKQLITRVAKTIADWGRKDGYFQSTEDGDAFEAELTYILVTQRAAFNSPVWFNVGVEAHPQCSACFINSVQDTMESILGLAKTEGMLFKYGSGTGSNLSPIRSSKELLQGGGTASGPVSFMKGFDSFAGVIKSGGKTRRAAKMVILNVEHPDIVEFVESKSKEEKKAHALIDAGFDGGFNVPGGAYDSVQFQNANHSVRVTDEFMRAVESDSEFKTKAVKDGRPLETIKAKELWRKMAVAAWECGDPGLQYDTTVNDWHTSPNSGRINASNPCSEYMYLDDSACNLASLNLMKFRDDRGELDVDALTHAVDIVFLGQEITVDNSSYPTPAIAKNSREYRPIGLGYANLGALLMARGLPYDSEEGRTYAAAITSLMHGRANLQSSRIAKEVGTFAGYQKNREPFLRVMHKHKEAAHAIPKTGVPATLAKAAVDVWDDVISEGEVNGFRNGQATVLAPTGTIGFMMDCDTTGIEPDIALIKYKKLVGGGLMKIVNQTVPEALVRLGYELQQIKEILNYLEERETIEGAPGLKPEHLPVFDCAFRAQHGTRSIPWEGHLRMMAAVQPFLSGAISKTVNMPTEATIEDVERAYTLGWKLGLKAVAIYRDGCKRSQPLSTSKEKTKEVDLVKAEAKPTRRRMPDERQSITHKFSIAGHEGYITVGMYEDGSPGEVFLSMSKEGTVVSGLVDSIAIAISLSLQHGVPLALLVEKYSHTRFEPSGFTGNPQIPMAKSILDYIFRWLALKFLTPTERKETELEAAKPTISTELNGSTTASRTLGDTPVNQLKFTFAAQTDAPPCSECGSIEVVRNGACYKCLNCGASMGCS